MAISNNKKDMQETIDAAVECARACRKCAAACLEEQNIDSLRECIRLDRDCAWICDLTSAYLLADSPFSTQACQLCADICEACALECENHREMAHCRECAEACRRCAETCKAISGLLV
jgi:hypothetical protein